MVPIQRFTEFFAKIFHLFIYSFIILPSISPLTFNDLMTHCSLKHVFYYKRTILLFIRRGFLWVCHLQLSYVIRFKISFFSFISLFLSFYIIFISFLQNSFLFLSLSLMSSLFDIHFFFSFCLHYFPLFLN